MALRALLEAIGDERKALESLLAALESLLECSWILLAPVQGIPCTGQFKPLGACTGDSLYRAITISNKIFHVHGIPCTETGPAYRGREPVGGDLGVYT